MCTHGCFATSFPPYPIVEPDDATDDYYYPEDAYYYMKPADD